MVLTAILALALTVGVWTAAHAAIVKYYDGAWPLDTWVTSPIQDITGGEVYSNCRICKVNIRTTLSWSPYYPLVEATAYGDVSMSHGRKDDSRSRCKHYWAGGGAGNADIRCWYKK